MEGRRFFDDGQHVARYVAQDEMTLGGKLGYWASRSLGYVLLGGSLVLSAVVLVSL